MSPVPAAPAEHVPPRSFKRRASRVTPGQADALARLWPSLGFDVDGSPLDVTALFGRTAPLVLEIGFGMGEATAQLAQAQPERDLIAVDVHTPGQGALLREVEQCGLTNVRVGDGDAVTLLRAMLGDDSLTEVRVFFPDPWPKARHWKRRLVDETFAGLVAQRLQPGGRLHVATDWAPYAEQVRRLLAGHASYDVVADVPWRPRTRFEQQGLDAGRPAHDVVAVRR
ncbi:MAG: tRNA (guanosine(46)-N7)-methyltransferase TrmB [Actinomycetes bacterium]